MELPSYQLATRNDMGAPMRRVTMEFANRSAAIVTGPIGARLRAPGTR
jgi:hypothetical protein